MCTLPTRFRRSSAVVSLRSAPAASVSSFRFERSLRRARVETAPSNSLTALVIKPKGRRQPEVQPGRDLRRSRGRFSPACISSGLGRAGLYLTSTTRSRPGRSPNALTASYNITGGIAGIHACRVTGAGNGRGNGGGRRRRPFQRRTTRESQGPLSRGAIARLGRSAAGVRVIRSGGGEADVLGGRACSCSLTGRHSLKQRVLRKGLTLL